MKCSLLLGPNFVPNLPVPNNNFLLPQLMSVARTRSNASWTIHCYLRGHHHRHTVEKRHNTTLQKRHISIRPLPPHTHTHTHTHNECSIFILALLNPICLCQKCPQRFKIEPRTMTRIANSQKISSLHPLPHSSITLQSSSLWNLGQI